MALGANRGMVLGMVIRHGGRLALLGLLLGLPLAFGLTRLLRSQLEGLGGFDPLLYPLVSVVLAGTAVLASWIPARRAASVNPSVTLTDSP
jgi:ABC-type antimicrobial peptide transport system permease subunit